MRVCHNGVKETLTEVRRKYWIVRAATRDRQSTLLTRPLQLLYPLEIDTEKPEVPCEDVHVAQEDQNPIVPESNERVVRAAAKKASQRTTAWIQKLQSQD